MDVGNGAIQDRAIIHIGKALGDVDMAYPDMAEKIAQRLHDAGLLAPNPEHEESEFITPEEARGIQDARGWCGHDWCPDDMHSSVEGRAIDTIASMHWLYGAQLREKHDWGLTLYMSTKENVEKYIENTKQHNLKPMTFRILRQMVGEEQVVPED